LALTGIPVLRIVLGPPWGVAADALGRGRAVLLVASLITLAGTVWLGAAAGAALLVGAVLLACGRAGSAGLVEAVTLQAVHQNTGRYGALRRWGSVGFLLAVLGAGVARDLWGVHPFWIGSALGTAFVILIATLPEGKPPPPSQLVPALVQVARDPTLVLLLVASAVHFASISVYDAFYLVYLERTGAGTTWAAAAVALGVLVEVGVMSAAGPLVARIGARTLLLSAMALNIPRWLLTAFLLDAAWLLPVQAVHGFTFGAFWLAAVAILSARTPSNLTGSTQGLLGAAVGGVGAALGNLVGAGLIDAPAREALFLGAAALSALATVLAVVTVRLDARPRIVQG
jgi:PPP family 3-phenylpropionic acid transporter